MNYQRQSTILTDKFETGNKNIAKTNNWLICFMEICQREKVLIERYFLFALVLLLKSTFACPLIQKNTYFNAIKKNSKKTLEDVKAEL